MRCRYAFSFRITSILYNKEKAGILDPLTKRAHSKDVEFIKPIEVIKEAYEVALKKGMVYVKKFTGALYRKIIALLLYPFLDLFVLFSEFFSGFKSASFQIRFSFLGMVIYYFLIFAGVKLLSRSKIRKL